MKRYLFLLWITLFCITGCSNSPDAQLLAARRYAKQGTSSTATAIRSYQKLLQIKLSQDFQEKIKFELGTLFLSIGRYADAIECFVGQKQEAARKKLAIAYLKNNQHADALAQFDRLGKLSDSDYLYWYGQAQEKNNLFEKAVETYAAIPKDSVEYAKAKARIDAINLSEDIVSIKHVKEILAKAPTQEQYPDAGAVIMRSDETFKVFDNNTAKDVTYFMAKIFNDRGKEKLSEIKIEYDSTFEEVQLDYARTIKPDGTVVTVGDKNIRDVSLYFNFPLYSNARARIISMPELTEGAIVEYKATIFHKQLINKKDFVEGSFLQDSEPVQEAAFTVIAPKDRIVNCTAFNAAYNKFGSQLEPQISATKNQKIYTWSFTNIPEIIPEPGMPPMAHINPCVMVSTFSSWQDVYQWWFALYKDKIKIDAAIQQKIDELIKGKETLEEKVRAIANFCAQDIRYVAVEYGQAGYEPHTAVDIFKNKYGDCKDQAILLVAMLRAIGAEAYPVLIGTFDHFELKKDFPSLLFNHCIAVVHLNNEWIFMDPTGQTVAFGDLPAGDQGRFVFVVLDQGYQIMQIPVFPSSHNTNTLAMDILVHADETIEAQRSVTALGVFQQGQRYWLQYTKPKLIEDQLKSTANAVAAGATVEKYTIENTTDLTKDIVLNYAFKAQEYLARAGENRLIPQLGSFDSGVAVLKERKYPLESSTLIETVVTTTIALPQHLSVTYVPDNIEVDSDWFEFINRYTTQNNTISFYQKFRMKKTVVTLADYPEYKRISEDIARKINQKIILEENPKAQ